MVTKYRTENKVHMKELVKRIAEITKYHNYEVEDVLNGFRVALLQYLIEGKDVEIEQVFTISAKPIPPRRVIHPVSKEEILSKGSVGLSVRPSRSLKEELLPILENHK